MQEAEAGRAARIHRSLTEYSSIIQAIDDVIDDALARNRKMDGALKGLLEAEQGFAARLAALAAEPARDAWRYEFVLEDAIDITEDSMELLAEDLGVRKRDVLAQEEDTKRRQKESMAPERRREIEQESARRGTQPARASRSAPASCVRARNSATNRNRPSSPSADGQFHDVAGGAADSHLQWQFSAGQGCRQDEFHPVDADHARSRSGIIDSRLGPADHSPLAGAGSERNPQWLGLSAPRFRAGRSRS